ncbi:hypothetical protein DDE01_00770 [Desulfovibrio desulfuricans]|nr:hypothetical protein DDE01_00770 [Desulfovibrio desulfuricans]
MRTARGRERSPANGQPDGLTDDVPDGLTDISEPWAMQGKKRAKARGKAQRGKAAPPSRPQRAAWSRLADVCGVVMEDMPAI